MSAQSRTFRVFISSTFNDMKAERNAMQAYVFPRLRELCQQHGARFQPIDLRWGVSEEASLDQQAMNICLGEIERCRKISPRPNFVILLGDRYGWMPPPAQIPDSDFRQIREIVSSPDKNLLLEWYRRDDNAVAPEWRLKPRGKGGPYERYADWRPIEESLQSILSGAITQLGYSQERALTYTASATHQEIYSGALQQKDAPEHVFCFFRQIQGLPSSFHMPDFLEMLSARLSVEYPRGLSKSCQELVHAIQALDPDSTPHRVNQHLKDKIKDTFEGTDEGTLLDFFQQVLTEITAKDFVNLEDETWSLDERAGQSLKGLKDRLLSDFKQNSFTADRVQWLGERLPSPTRPYSLLTSDHIGSLPDTLVECEPLLAQGYQPQTLCEALFRSLANVILAEINHPLLIESEKPKITPIKLHENLGEEGLAHHDFAEKRLEFFVGRKNILAEIETYLRSGNRCILAITGGGGTGKSALLAKAIQLTQQTHPDSQLVYRFIAATPGSSDGLGLLSSLCRELSRRYGVDEKEIPTDYRDLVPEFSQRMGSASAKKPLILFLDSLDQLSTSHNAHNLIWLPAELPEHVHLIVSTRDQGEAYQSLCAKPIIEKPLLGLRIQEGKDLLKQWLDHIGRELQPTQHQEVLDKFKASGCNPLYLKLAFEEARLWTSYQPVEELATSVPGIIQGNMIHRLAHEGNHGDVLVSHALGYLAASRYGLTEDELVDLLSRDLQVYEWFFRQTYHLPSDLLGMAAKHLRQHPELVKDLPLDTHLDTEIRALRWLKQDRTPPDSVVSFLEGALLKPGGPRLPIVLWSRLSFDLAPYLAERLVDGSRLLSFYHRELGDVSKAAFLSGDTVQVYHERLADYFRTRIDPGGDFSWEGSYPRGLSELPYHLVHSKQWENLETVLSDFQFLRRKAEVIGAQALVGDFLEAKNAGALTPCTRNILETLQISIRVLDRYPEQIAGQLYGRLLTSRESKVQKLVQQIFQETNTPWLRPLNPGLAPPSGVLKHTILGHLGAVARLHIKNDGTYAYSTGRDGIGRYWDLKTGIEQFDRSAPEIVVLQNEIETQPWVQRPEKPISPAHETKFTFYKPDGTQAISIEHRSDFSAGYHHFSHYQINLWSFEPESQDQPTLIRSLESASRRGEGNGEGVWVVAIDPDGKRAAVAGNLNVSGDLDDDDSFLALWDLESGKILNHMIFPFKNGPNRLALNRDGSLAVVAFGDGDLKILDLDKGKSGNTEGLYLGKHQGVITTLALTPDGHWALSGHSDGIIRVWDLEQPTDPEPSAGHINELDTLQMSMNGRKMVTKTRYARNVYEWSIAEKTTYRVLMASEDLISELTIAPGGKYFAVEILEYSNRSADYKIRVWDIPENREVCTFSLAEVSGKKIFKFWKIWLSPNGESLLISWESSNSPKPPESILTICDLSSGLKFKHLPNKGYILRNQVSHDKSVQVKKEIRVWDLNTGNITLELPIQAVIGARAYIPPDNWKYWVNEYITTNCDWVVLRADRKSIQIYDIKQGKFLKILGEHRSLISAVAISANGNRAVSADESGVLTAWDVEAGAELFSISEGVAFALEMDYFGRFAYFACEDGRVGVWDLDNGAVIARHFTDGVLTHFSAAPEVLRLAAGEKSGRVHVLALENVAFATPLVTPQPTGPGSIVLHCPYCGCPSEAEQLTMENLMLCPDCGLALKLKPLEEDRQPRQEPFSTSVEDFRKRGDELRAAGNLTEALAFYDQGLKRQPKDLNLLDKRTAVLNKLGRYQDAVETLDFVIDNNLAAGLNLANMFGAKGHALVALGKYEQARDYYRKAIENECNVHQVWYMQGLVLQQLEDYQGAVDSYQKALAIKKDETISISIGYCYFSLKKYSLAEKQYRELVEAGSSHPLAYHGLGVALVHLHHYDQACKWLRLFLKEVGPEYQHLVADIKTLVNRFCRDGS